MLIEKANEKDNLILRCLTAKDATERYLNWLQDRKVNAFLEARFNPPKNVAELAGYIQATGADSDSLLLGIFKKKGANPYWQYKAGPHKS